MSTKITAFMFHAEPALKKDRETDPSMAFTLTTETTTHYFLRGIAEEAADIVVRDRLKLIMVEECEFDLSGPPRSLPFVQTPRSKEMAEWVRGHPAYGLGWMAHPTSPSTAPDSRPKAEGRETTS